MLVDEIREAVLAQSPWDKAWLKDNEIEAMLAVVREWQLGSAQGVYVCDTEAWLRGWWAAGRPEPVLPTWECEPDANA